MPALTALAIAGLATGALSGGAGIISGLKQRNRKVESQWDPNKFQGLQKLTDPMATWKAFSPQLSRLNQFNAANLNRLAAAQNGSGAGAAMLAGKFDRESRDAAFGNAMQTGAQVSFQANQALAGLQQGYDLQAQNLTEQNYQMGQQAVLGGLNSFANAGFGLAGQEMGYQQMMGGSGSNPPVDPTRRFVGVGMGSTGQYGTISNSGGNTGGYLNSNFRMPVMDFNPVTTRDIGVNNYSAGYLKGGNRLNPIPDNPYRR